MESTVASCVGADKQKEVLAVSSESKHTLYRRHVPERYASAWFKSQEACQGGLPFLVTLQPYKPGSDQTRLLLVGVFFDGLHGLARLVTKV